MHLGNELAMLRELMAGFRGEVERTEGDLTNLTNIRRGRYIRRFIDLYLFRSVEVDSEKAILASQLLDYFE